MKEKTSNEESISIVIPTYNRSETLKKVIPSYLSQKGVKEILIVNDGSTDNTDEFINSLRRKHPKVQYIEHSQNRGLPATRNTGVKNSSGEYVLFGEDDVIFADNYASQLLQCSKKTGADILGGRGVFPYPDESFEEAIARADRFEGDLVDKRFLRGNYLKKVSDDVPVIFLHACILVKRKLFNEISYDEEYRGNAYREESDFCVEAGERGYKVYFCPHTLFYHLARERTTKGGARQQGVFSYRCWVLRNTHRFLRKHYPYLKEELKLKDSIWKLMLFQFFSELAKTFTYFLRKYFPSAYSFLARKLNFLNW